MNMLDPINLPEEGTIDWLLSKCWEIRLGDAKLALEYAEEALWRSEQTNDVLNMGRSMTFIAFFSFSQNQISEAILLTDRALSLFDSVENEYEKSIVYVLRGGCYLQIGDYDRGFEDILKGLEYGNKYNHLQALAIGKYFLGNHYLETHNYKLATQYYEETLATFIKMEDKSGIATTIAGLGNIASHIGEKEKALKYHYESLHLSKEINNPQVEARNLHDLGVIYESLGQYDKAITYVKESLVIRKDKNILQGVISCHISIGSIYAAKQWFDLAIEELQISIQVALSISANPKLVKAYKMLSELYKKNQQPWEALEALEKSIELKGWVVGDESNAKLKAIQALNQSEQDKQETVLQKQYNAKLQIAYDKIESQNQHIIDSIKYARRIQEALLPPESELKQYAEYAFVFYRPKDIVSGDFYWFSMYQEQIILACVDCTGHGVPGAFMVVMGISLLEEIVNEQHITEPIEILIRLDQKVRQALKQDQIEGSNNQDGMDLSIVRFCTNKSKISFAGARSSLYYVRADEITEVKSSIYPIGSSQYTGKKEYEQFELDFLPNDVFYMATDGFCDQFGGEDNKKYNKPRFRQLLKTMSHLPMQEQYNYLGEVLQTWKKHYTQTDDILVMGFKTLLKNER